MYKLVQYKKDGNWTKWELANTESDEFKRNAQAYPVRVLLDSDVQDNPNVAWYRLNGDQLQIVRIDNIAQLYTSDSDPEFTPENHQKIKESANNYLQTPILTVEKIDEILKTEPLTNQSPQTYDEDTKNVLKLSKDLKQLVTSNKSVDEQILALKNFLSKHYRNIICTKQDYLVTPKHPATILLKAIAQQIAVRTGESSVDILMPVEVINSNRSFYMDFNYIQSHSRINDSFKEYGPERTKWYVKKLVCSTTLKGFIRFYQYADENNKRILIEAMQERWPSIINSVRDLKKLLGILAEKEDLQIAIIQKSKGILYSWWNDYFDEDDYFNDIDTLLRLVKKLPIKPAIQIIKAIEWPWHVNDFADLLRKAPEKLKDALYDEMKENLPAINNLNDLLMVLKQLKVEQCKEVCEKFKLKLPKIEDIPEFWGLMNDLCDEKFKLVCDLYKTKLTDLASNLSDLPIQDERKKEIFQKAVIQARLEKYKKRIETYISKSETSPHNAVNQSRDQSKDVELKALTRGNQTTFGIVAVNQNHAKLNSSKAFSTSSPRIDFGRGIWFSTANGSVNREASYNLVVSLLNAFPSLNTIKDVQRWIKDNKSHLVKSSELRSIIEDVQSIKPR